MKAMVLDKQGEPLVLQEKTQPEYSADQVLIKVNVCAVCRTDLHVCDGDLTKPKLPLIPGHEIVGEIVAIGGSVKNLNIGDRVGVPWLGFTCGQCLYCQQGAENLCDFAQFTGYQIDGGYAEYTVAHQRYVFGLPDAMTDIEAAPLLCAGLIGYRSYKMTGDPKRLGLYGFGAAAHITIQIARYEGRDIYAFTQSGDKTSQSFAKDLGAVWVGDANQSPPELLDAAIIYAPVGDLVPAALRSLRKGGIVICAGIHMRFSAPWLGFTCGQCLYCQQGAENLCDFAQFTGYQIDGGYAEYTVAHQRYVFGLPDAMTDIEAAPLLCAGLIGYRSYKMTGDPKRLGLYGFGAAAHITIQIARYEGRDIYAFTQSGDKTSQSFAKDLGAVWVGDANQSPPELLDAAIIYAPVGDLVPAALRSLRKGGIVICAGIHMSDIPTFPYNILWGERSIKSVANLTRKDGEEFFALAEKIPVKTETTTFTLEDANIALNKLRQGELQGAAVLVNE